MEVNEWAQCLKSPWPTSMHLPPFILVNRREPGQATSRLPTGVHRLFGPTAAPIPQRNWRRMPMPKAAQITEKLAAVGSFAAMEGPCRGGHQ